VVTGGARGSGWRLPGPGRSRREGARVRHRPGKGTILLRTPSTRSTFPIRQRGEGRGEFPPGVSLLVNNAGITRTAAWST